jgi:hypothetical protein
MTIIVARNTRLAIRIPMIRPTSTSSLLGFATKAAYYVIDLLKLLRPHVIFHYYELKVERLYFPLYVASFIEQ